MAKKKSLRGGKTAKKKTISLNDERIPKILGIVCLFASLYLFVSFISYFYTWKADQDKVFEFSWSIIFQSDLSVDNWLGRSGAYLSNLFMYWGFGVPSLFITVLLSKLGLDLIRKRSLTQFFKWSRYGILGMSFIAILLEFIFTNDPFSWGGIFGSVSTLWLINFLGQIGLILLLSVILISTLVWYFNPKLDQIDLALPGTGMSLPGMSFFDMFRVSEEDQPVKKRTRKSSKGDAEANATTEEFEVLTPSFSDKYKEKEKPAETKSKGKLGEPDKLELELKEAMAPNATPFVAVGPSTPESKTAAKPKSKTVDIPERLEIHTERPARDEDEKLAIEEENRRHTDPYDSTLDLAKYQAPQLELLEGYEEHKVEIDRGELEANKDQIIETLGNYNIKITKIRATIGPTVTLYEIVPAPGVKISKIKNLEDDIALSLSALGIRIIAPIPGKGTIGIEVPNKKKQIVSLKEVLRSDKFANAKMDLPIALGKTISNEVFVADLAKMPHLLIAGATGQGKSVGINTVLMSLLYKKHPSQVKLVLIDPKKVELFPYSSLEKHFLAFLPDAEESIITETSKVIHTLNSLCIEMEERYELLKKARSRNIKEYNEKFVGRKLNPNNGHKFMPFIVLVIDEFADLIMTAGKEVELPIARLAQLARAVGIHLIIATQRPSVNIITGVIKANFPARIAFKVTSKIDSRTILDAGGADQLIGRGDMLLSVGGNVVRLQCAFVDTPEVEKVIDHIGNQKGYAEPFYLPEYKGDDDSTIDGSNIKPSDLDDMFETAARLVVANQHGSTSMLQRKLQLGYNRAGRIMDQLEALGMVGEARGSKPREVLIASEYELEHILDQIKNR